MRLLPVDMMKKRTSLFVTSFDYAEQPPATVAHLSRAKRQCPL